MNRRILFCLLLVFLTGCNLPFLQENGQDELIGKIVIEDISSEHVEEFVEIQQPINTQGGGDGTVVEKTEETQDEVEKIVVTNDEETTGYAYSVLGEEDQVLYLEILEILITLGEDIEVSAMDTDKIDKVFQCVMLDHPEIFYVDGYTYTQHTLADVLQKITFTGIYLYDAEEIFRRNELLLASANDFLSGITMDATEYEKVKYVYEEIINRCQYNLEASDSQNICSVLLNNESVCQGYAKTMQYLLQKLDVTVALVAGGVSSGEGHVWNLVQIDGAYYYVDSTWGDASYTIASETQIETITTPSINYDYLCITTEQLLETHTIDDIVPMPYCSATVANYYVMENLYFTYVDKDMLTQLFEEAYHSDAETVTIKCQSKEVYQEMITYLIEEQGIFSYLQNQNASIAYSYMEEQYSVSFWL
ncbi:MAG: hypothetical protein R3Y24_10270 [Eubacteriales bacterium]